MELEVPPEHFEPKNFSITISGYSIVGASIAFHKAIKEVADGSKFGIVFASNHDDRSAASYEVWN